MLSRVGVSKVMSTEKLSPLFQLRNILSDMFYRDKKYFLGRALTIIDASIADSEQRKGIKDLIHNAYHEQGACADSEMRIVLLEFAERFCPTLVPKTKEARVGFMGEDSPPSPSSYFNED